MKTFEKNIVWVFLLTASALFGQIEKDIPGTYVMKEEKGMHFVPGISFGNIHPTSYVSSVDTTITHTIILDSLHKVTFIPDTSFHFTLTANFLPDPIVKMHGEWVVENDSLFITYTSIDSTYSHNLNALVFIDTLSDSIKIDQTTLPYKDTESTQLNSPIKKQFAIRTSRNKICWLIPFGEKREWIIYRKQ